MTEEEDVQQTGGPDPAGERGGDTGPSDDPKGGEKGDLRRDKPVHSGPTRPGGSGRGRPGSESNES